MAVGTQTLRVVKLTALMVKIKPIYFLFLLPIFIISIFIVANVTNPLFGQGESTPSATTSQEFFTAPIKYARVVTNNNKTLDDLASRIGPAATTAKFNVIVMLNKSVDLIPTLKTRHGTFTAKFTYPSINGFATNLTKGQVITFSKDTDVKLVEFDALAFPNLNTSQE